MASHESQMLRALASKGPFRDHADKLMLFGQFVGSWLIDATLIEPDGTRTERRGEWHFDWVLEGRAIQDVLISPPRADRAGGPSFEYGTTLRFYEPSSDVWQVTYVTPVGSAVINLLARAVGDEIVLEGRGPDGGRLRWTFSEITADRFLWRGEVSSDGGAWFENEQMRARRREVA